MPARSNAFCVAGMGPTPIIAGSTPAIAILLTIAMGCRLNNFTASSLASNNAAAPSLIPLLLPAVTVPSFINAGFNVQQVYPVLWLVDVRLEQTKLFVYFR